MADIKFVNEANLRRYTKKVQAADEASAKTVKSNATDSSTTGEFPLLLNSKVYNAQGGAGTTDEVKLDTGLRYKPSTQELIISDGTHSSTFSPTGGDAGDFTGTTTVGIVAGTSSAAPKVQVKVGSSSTATSGEITKASDSAYGVVKVDSSLSTSSTNPVQNKKAKEGIDAAAKTVRQTMSSSGSHPVALSLASNSGDNAEIAYSNNVSISDDATNRGLSVTTTIGAPSTPQSYKIEIKNGKVYFGNNSAGYIDGENYTGHANATETALAESDEIGEGANQGASMIGYYDPNNEVGVTVAYALNELYELIGDGSGDSSLSSRVTNLEHGTELNAANNNVTIQYNSTSGKVDVSTLDEKVSQTADTTTTSGLPILLAPNSLGGTAGTKFRSNVMVVPSSGTFKVSDVGGTAQALTITNSTITFISGEVGGTDGTLTRTQYSGNAATATSATSATTATTATNLANAPSISITAGTSSAAPKVNVTAGGKSGTAQELTKGDATHYGCVKVDASPTSGSSNAVSSGGVLTAITNAISSYKNSSWAIVTQLPTADGTHQGIIYLIKDNTATSPNVYDEYIEIDETPTGSTRTWKFEKIGTTDAGVDVVSLTDSEIDAIWANPEAA